MSPQLAAQNASCLMSTLACAVFRKTNEILKLIIEFRLISSFHFKKEERTWKLWWWIGNASVSFQHFDQ
jgi:hypothetical protein